MSLYNIMNGVTVATFFVLPMLGKHPDEYPRFRDCFLQDEDHPEYNGHIHVYTRVGGGNRDDYQGSIDEMRKHPNYIADFDDSFDSTFASFIFSVPDEWKEDFEKFTSGRGNEFSEAYKQRIFEVFPKLKEKLEQLFNPENQ